MLWGICWIFSCIIITNFVTVHDFALISYFFNSKKLSFSNILREHTFGFGLFIILAVKNLESTHHASVVCGFFIWCVATTDFRYVFLLPSSLLSAIHTGLMMICSTVLKLYNWVWSILKCHYLFWLFWPKTSACGLTKSSFLYHAFPIRIFSWKDLLM